MTNFDVDTKQGAIISDESPSLLQAWWMNWNLRYDLSMGSIILMLNISAIVYMIAHGIPFTDSEPLIALIVFPAVVYVNCGVLSCICWFAAIENVSMSKFYFVGRISHTTGFFIFFVLVYSISSHLALCACLPFLLFWFVPVMIAPACPSIYKGLRDWWKRVNQPQPPKTLPV